MEFKDKLKKLRKKKKLTQKELANIAGINEMSIYYYEKGKVKPKLEQLAKLAEALDVPIGELMSVPLPKALQIREVQFENGQDFANALNKTLIARDFIDSVLGKQNYQEYPGSQEECDRIYEIIELMRSINDEGQEKIISYAKDISKKYLKSAERNNHAEEN